MTDYAIVLQKKFPNSKWELLGNEYEDIIWKSDDHQPTKKELDDLGPIVKREALEEIKAKQVAREAVLVKLGLSAEEAAVLLGQI